MGSITLLHPEETFAIPTLQAMTKCSLFQNNPTLLVSPYRVQSPVSLSIFREFISAFQGNTINTTDTNFTELQQLCEEFGFPEFPAKLSKFNPPSNDSQGTPIKTPLTELRKAFLKESFKFILNGSEIESEVCESAAFFPAVREQLAVDSCARKFFVTEADIHFLEFLLSGESIGCSEGGCASRD
jgi:hypothetical protein